MELAAQSARRVALGALRWLPPAVLPLAAYATEQAIRILDASAPRFWWAAVAVQVLWLLGYGCSSLPEWAQWKDRTGGDVAVAERRLKIIQRMLLACLAGNVAYYGGYYYFGLAEVGCFLAAAVGAYGGDKFLGVVLSRITGRAGQEGG